jgi:alkanesulfonate monooxygenase SsuD/methylene tetrahydromethanopterin reductase-like flavin-dependent oxidoreductase (luciferase family)
VKIGVALPHYGDDVSLDDVIAVAQDCERFGYDSVWVSDHLTFDLAKYGGSDDPIGSLEPLTTLAAIARETTTLRLGTMVLCNEFRHPIVLAKQAAQIDRLELGIGAGWYEPEFRRAGLEFPRAGVRLERLAEAVQILQAAFTGEAQIHMGKHYEIDGIAVRPRPASPPTIWIGGKGDRAVRMIASIANDGLGWNAAWFSDPVAYAERARLLGDAKVRRSIGQYAEGSATEMADRLCAFADLGVEHAVMCFSKDKIPFALDDREDLARFAGAVLPRVRD